MIELILRQPLNLTALGSNRGSSLGLSLHYRAAADFLPVIKLKHILIEN